MIKDYLEYRKNKKIIKRESAKIIAPALAFINDNLTKFNDENSRVIGTITYLLGLSPQEIEQILTYSVVKTNTTEKSNE